MLDHPYFTRSKAKPQQPSTESSLSSSSITPIRHSVAMATSRNEDANSLPPSAAFPRAPESHVRIGTTQSNIPSSSPSHHSSKPPVEFSPEFAQVLQHEVAALKTELHRFTSSHSQSSNDKPNPLNFQSTLAYPTNTSTQSSTTTSTHPPIQYVLNIDPLQQMKDFVKPFLGNPEDDATKWLDSIVHFIDIIRLPANKDELCFQYAPAFLKAYAYRWWNENKNFIYDWSCFKRMFIEQFGEKNEYLLEQQLNQRKQQPNEPVIKYYYDMIDLCHKCDPTMSDKQKIRKLILGLRLSLYQEAIKEDYSTPKQFLIKAQQFENIEKLVELRIDDSTTRQQCIDEPVPLSLAESSSYVQHQGPSSPFSSHNLSRSNIHSASSDSRPYPALLDPPRDSPSSPSTKRFPHSSNSTLPSPSPDPTHMMNYQCYHCGQWGHVARNCRQRHNPSSSSSAYRQQKNQ
jgi:hypothetical protein